MTAARHWAEFEAAEEAARARASIAMGQRMGAAAQRDAEDRPRWDAIYRGAIVAAAEAIEASDWAATLPEGATIEWWSVQL